MEVKALPLIYLLGITCPLNVAGRPATQTHTNNSSPIFCVVDNGRLYQSYLGKKLNYEADISHLPQGTEAYITHGTENYLEPAIHTLHNGNSPSLLLKYAFHEAKVMSQGVNETIITLGDDKYLVTVKLHYVIYPVKDIIEIYTGVSRKERKPIVFH